MATSVRELVREARAVCDLACCIGDDPFPPLVEVSGGRCVGSKRPFSIPPVWVDQDDLPFASFTSSMEALGDALINPPGNFTTVAGKLRDLAGIGRCALEHRRVLTSGDPVSDFSAEWDISGRLVQAGIAALKAINELESDLDRDPFWALDQSGPPPKDGPGLTFWDAASNPQKKMMRCLMEKSPISVRDFESTPGAFSKAAPSDETVEKALRRLCKRLELTTNGWYVDWDTPLSSSKSEIRLIRPNSD